MSNVIPLDLALALLAAHHPHLAAEAVDTLHALRGETVVHSASSLDVPEHVSTQDWDDPDNG